MQIIIIHQATACLCDQGPLRCFAAVTSTAYRQYFLTFGSINQTFAYRLHQNITFQDCPPARHHRVIPAVQQLSVDRIFALYNDEERVLRYAITNQIGSSEGELCRVIPDSVGLLKARAEFPAAATPPLSAWPKAAGGKEKEDQCQSTVTTGPAVSGAMSCITGTRSGGPCATESQPSPASPWSLGVVIS